jgi:hypothetical protein
MAVSIFDQGCRQHRAEERSGCSSVTRSALQVLGADLRLSVSGQLDAPLGASAVEMSCQFALTNSRITAQILPATARGVRIVVNDLVELTAGSCACELCILNAILRAEALRLAPWL